MRKVLIDAHTHTVASGHAYSSLQEMVRAAADKGLGARHHQDPDFPAGIKRRRPAGKAKCLLLFSGYHRERIRHMGHGGSDHPPL